MHRLIPTSRSLLSMASAPPRWWRLPLMAASNPPVRLVSRFCHGSQNKASSSGVRGEEKSGKPENRQLIPSARDIMKNVENSDTTKEFIARHRSVKCICSTGRRSSVDIIFGDDEARRTTTDVTDGEQGTWGEFGEVLLEADADNRAANVRQAAAAHQSSVDRVVSLNWLPDSSHRDGSVYRDTYAPCSFGLISRISSHPAVFFSHNKPANSAFSTINQRNEQADEWQKDYRIADRTETRLEAMMFSNPTDCDMVNGICLRHYPRHMLQIFSLKLAKIPVGAGKVELYGYIAARDELEPFLNYVVNISRDDPFTAEQGSLINMAPKRGISLDYGTLIEYDMKIKTGEQEKDDLQLIDGASVIGLMGTVDRSVFTSRIIGDYGAIDISASRLDRAVEVTVEVTASEVQDIFRLCLGCFISGLHKEIRLFDGTIGEPCGLKRYVVAVVMGTQMELKFKVGAESSGYSEHCCSFTAHQHGHADQLIKTDFASFLVKVTRSVLPSEKNLGATTKRV